MGGVTGASVAQIGRRQSIYETALTRLEQQASAQEAVLTARAMAEETVALDAPWRDKLLFLSDIVRAACASHWADQAETGDIQTANWRLWHTLTRLRTKEEIVASVAKMVEYVFRSAMHKTDRDRDEIVARCLQYIEDNYHSADLTLESMADLVHLSPSHISRLIHRELGISFIRFLTKLRIEKAKKLMVEEQAPLYWVARRVGYKSASYFSRVFRKEMGMSPNSFREQHRQ